MTKGYCTNTLGILFILSMILVWIWVGVKYVFPPHRPALTPQEYYQVKILAPEEPTEENINQWLRKHPGWEPIYSNWGSYVVPHFWVKRKFINHRQKERG